MKRTKCSAEKKKMRQEKQKRGEEIKRKVKVQTTVSSKP